MRPAARISTVLPGFRKVLTIGAALLLLTGATVRAEDLLPNWTSVPVGFYPLAPGVPLNPVLTAADVTDAQAVYVADPFLMHEDGVWHMFFEVYNGPPYRGDIGHATSTDGLRWNYDRIVLTDGRHHSYPFVLKYNGEYFMTPESGNQQEVRLYRATDYPYSWTYVATLLSGRRFVDPTIIRYQGLWWMFVGDSDHPRCYLFYSTQLDSGWVEHPMSPIVNNDPGRARPAGRSTVFDGNRIIRLAQKNDLYYGEAVRAFEVDLLDRNHYAEHEIPESPILGAGGAGWNSDGMHQCDPWWTGTFWLAAVDGIEDWWSIGIYRTAVSASADPREGGPSATRLDLTLSGPNPFRPSGEIRYGIRGSSGPLEGELNVYDATGRPVAGLLRKPIFPGAYTVVWNGADDSGKRTASGVYFCRLCVEGRCLTRPMVLIR